MKKHSKILIAFVVVTAVLASGFIYTAKCNPEMVWLLKVEVTKRQAALQPGHNRLLIAGDSSVLFGIDAEAIEKITGHSAINLGLHGNMGPLALLGYAEQFARPGDTLIISITPDLLDGNVETMRLGNQFMFLTGNTSVALGGKPSLASSSSFAKLRIFLDVTSPGLRQMVNHIGKMMFRRPLYRYEALRPDSHGYVAEKIYLPYALGSQGDIRISREWKKALTKYVARCEKSGVRVAYSLPWFQRGERSNFRISEFLGAVNSVMPVVIDFGGEALTDRNLFSDSPGHLSEKGAFLRSRLLGAAMAQGNIAPKNMLLLPDKKE